MTHLSFTAARDLAEACGLPSYLADEVAEASIGDMDFAPEATVFSQIDSALRDLRGN
jgi:hypothetical protein